MVYFCLVIILLCYLFNSLILSMVSIIDPDKLFDKLDNIESYLGKIAEAYDGGKINQLLAQEAKRRDDFKSRPIAFSANEMSQAYTYFWRQMKESETKTIKEQLEIVYNLFYQLCEKFDPLSFDETVWFYYEELESQKAYMVKDEVPPFLDIPNDDGNRHYFFLKAKMLYLYYEMRKQLVYLLKMNINFNKSVRNKEKNMNKKKKVKPDKFKKAVEDTVSNENPKIEDYYSDDGDDKLTEAELYKKYHEPELRKNTIIDNLHLKVKEYLSWTEHVVNTVTEEEPLYDALGRLYDKIDNENGGFIDDITKFFVDEEYSKIGHELQLFVTNSEKTKGEELLCFVARVREVFNDGFDVNRFAGGENMVEGRGWEPHEGLYPAKLVLYCLLSNIEQVMQWIRNMVKLTQGKELPKHIFPTVNVYLNSKGEVYTQRIYEEQRDQYYEEYIVLPPKEIIKKNTVDFLSDQGEETKLDYPYMDVGKARCIYGALVNEDVKWLIEPSSKEEFVKLLLSVPDEKKKIKLQSSNQVKYLAKEIIFYRAPKKGKSRSNMTQGEWDIIKKLFDCENGNIEGCHKRNKKPANCDIFYAEYKKLMGKNKKKKGE